MVKITFHLTGKRLSFQEQQNRFETLNQWFSSSLGQHVAQAFSRELAHLKNLLHGNILLQLGNCDNNQWLNCLRFQHKWLAAAWTEPHQTTFCSNFNQLPLDRDCIDCLIAPLTLEAFTAKNPLDEIDRVLKPMGYVVFFGINPISLWGAWLKYSKNSCFGPLKGHTRSALTIKRAMLHRGYIQCHFNVFYYTPPLRNEKTRAKFELLNQISKMISLNPAGFYCLVMQKYVENHIPLSAVTDQDRVIDTPVSLRPICRK